jgi:hypothetical protein
MVTWHEIWNYLSKIHSIFYINSGSESGADIYTEAV